MSSPNFEPPKSDSKDTLHSGIKIITSLVPGVGGLAAEIFGKLMPPPIEKRQQAWMESVAEGLQALEEKYNEFKIESLPENEVFVSTLLEATRAAMLTHQKEKLLALRNAVLNSALPQSPDETRQKMFLQLIDKFTEWHLKILNVFDNRNGIPELNLDKSDWTMNLKVDQLATLIEKTYPEMKNQYRVYIQITKDLHSEGLISNLDIRKGMMTRIDRSPKVTPFGAEFLKFLKSPLE